MNRSGSSSFVVMVAGVALEPCCQKLGLVGCKGSLHAGLDVIRHRSLAHLRDKSKALV